MPESKLALADWIWRNVVTVIQVHDEPMPGVWTCGRCPYMNSGVICTKCGAYRWEGREFRARGRGDHHHEYVGGNCIHCTLPSVEKALNA